MVSQPPPTGRTYLGTKDSSGWRESSHPSHSQPSEGREGQEHWAQSESESDCTWLPSCKRNLGSSFSCYHGLTQWALASPTSAVSRGDHSWKLPRTAWAFRVFQQGAGSAICLVPAGPWLGMIQSLLKLQLYSKVAWTPQSMGITGLDTSSPQGSQACTSLACSDHGSPASQLCPNSLWMLNNLKAERQLLVCWDRLAFQVCSKELSIPDKPRTTGRFAPEVRNDSQRDQDRVEEWDQTS